MVWENRVCPELAKHPTSYASLYTPYKQYQQLGSLK